MKDDNDHEDTDMDSECDYSDDDSEFFRTIIDNDQFTIENIGEVNMQVKGTVVSAFPSLPPLFSFD